MSRLNQLFILFLISTIAQLSFATTYRLKQLSTNEGLSQYDIECVMQDKLGYIWVGSYDGLNRYDGNSLTIFRRIPADSTSIVDNRIQCLAEWKSRDEIWIGTEGRGLCSYNLKTNRFSRPKAADIEKGVIKSLHCCNETLWVGGFSNIKSIQYDASDNIHVKEYILDNGRNINMLVNVMSHDSEGNIIAGTTEQLFCKSPSSESFIPVLDEVNVSKLLLDNMGGLWMVASGKLYYYSLLQQRIKNYLKTPVLIAENIDGDDIFSINAITDQLFLVNTETKLYWMIKDIDRFRFDPVQFTDELFFHNNKIRSTFLDSTMNVWINSTMEGVASFDLNQKQIHRQVVVNEGFDNRMFIQSLTQDSDNRLWIGTRFGCYITSGEGLTHRIGAINESIFGLFRDSDKNIWCSSFSGIYFFSKGDDKNPHSLFQDKHFPATISRGDGPYSICEDRRHQNIWIGLRSGLLQVKKREGKIEKYKHYNYSMFNVKRLSNITTLLLLPERNTMIITTSNSGVFEGILNNSGELVKVKKISSCQPRDEGDHVWSIIHASDGKIYVGTDSGLRLLELNTTGEYIMRHIPTSDLRLQTNKIVAILEDRQSNLWLSTGSGLISYNLNTKKTALYLESDGLITRILAEGSYFDSSVNRLYIGSIRGLNVVELNSMIANELPPRTVIQNIRVNNEIIYPGTLFNDRIILPLSLNYTSEIQLKYFENNISFDFASLHFSNPDKNQYAYQLEGFNSKWVELGNLHTATFTNLSPGHYILWVKSCNGDGVWEKTPLRLDIYVKCAPWLSVWAYIVYAILLASVLYFINKEISTRRRIKHDHFVEQLEQQKKLEVAEIKLKYHTNITHELRTPLSLIVAPIQELVDKQYADSFLSSRLKSIKNNSDRLLQLIAQFLDLRKIISDKYTLHIRYQRVDENLYQIKKNFESVAEAKHIRFELFYDANIRYAWCDIEVINKICYNIISNAFKYTPEGERVSIYVTSDIELRHLSISVEDTGMGIAEEEIDSIFERFYQSPNSVGGTGIGLHLCRHLTLLHRGKINVVSRKGEGSIFTVKLPIYKDAYEESEIFIDELPAPLPEEEESSQSMIEIDGKDLILIVEDNTELRQYLASSLSEDADVIEAENGEIGYNLAINHIPSIIISDIMMPVMDGIELVKRCKTNTITSHIPFILLTAKDSIESEIEGLTYGAEDYITKPFNTQALKLKIKNLKKLVGNSSANPEETNPTLNERDLNFITEFERIVLENLSSPDFGVENVCEKMCVSRMQMHRKMIAILSKKPSQYVKEIRMKNALEIMKTKGYNITETMQAVGYTNHSYFSKLFVEVNGISPREIIKNNTQA